MRAKGIRVMTLLVREYKLAPSTRKNITSTWNAKVRRCERRRENRYRRCGRGSKAIAENFAF